MHGMNVHAGIKFGMRPNRRMTRREHTTVCFSPSVSVAVPKYSCDQKLSVFSVLKTFLIPNIAFPVDSPISFVMPSKSYCWALTRAVSKSFAKFGITKAGFPERRGAEAAHLLVRRL